MAKNWAFYTESKDKLFAYLMRMTGDYEQSSDILQESFTRYLEHYKDSAPNLSLIYTIARNVIFDESRKQSRNRKIAEQAMVRSSDQEERLLVRDEYKRVLESMQGLERSERDILALVISRDLTYRQIASITGISEANVKVKIHRARLKLRKMLKGETSHGRDD